MKNPTMELQHLPLAALSEPLEECLRKKDHTHYSHTGNVRGFYKKISLTEDPAIVWKKVCSPLAISHAIPGLEDFKMLSEGKVTEQHFMFTGVHEYGGEMLENDQKKRRWAMVNYPLEMNAFDIPHRVRYAVDATENGCILGVGMQYTVAGTLARKFSYAANIIADIAAKYAVEQAVNSTARKVLR